MFVHARRLRARRPGRTPLLLDVYDQTLHVAQLFVLPHPSPGGWGGGLPIVSSTSMCPCFEPFYYQIAHAKTQFYFYDAYKMYPLSRCYGNDVS